MPVPGNIIKKDGIRDNGSRQGGNACFRPVTAGDSEVSMDGEYSCLLDSITEAFVKVANLRNEVQLKFDKNATLCSTNMIAELERCEAKLNKCQIMMKNISKTLLELEILTLIETRRKRLIRTSDDSTAPDLQKLYELRNHRTRCAYNKVLNEAQLLTSELNSMVQNKMWVLALNKYDKLRLLKERIENSSCKHLKSYLEKVTAQWKSYFENLCLKWIYDSTEKLGLVYYDKEKSANTVFQKQHFIDIGNLAMTVAMKIADLEELPKIFASPFTRRFVYFFCSSKTADMTMDKVKPEHYLSVAFYWISEGRKWIEEICKCQMHDKAYEFSFKFARIILDQVVERVLFDLKQAVLDDDVERFSHIIDEMSAFDVELRRNKRIFYANFTKYNPSDYLEDFPCTEPGCMEVLVNDDLFDYWYTLENDEMTKYINGVSKNAKSWKPRFENQSAEDKDKVPYCVDRFLILIVAFVRRFKLVISFNHRLRLAKLLCSLLVEFYDCLLSLSQTFNIDNHQSPVAELLNGIAYLVRVLKQWQEQPIFVQLHPGLFDKVVAQFCIIQDNCLDGIVKAEVTRLSKLVRGKFRPALERGDALLHSVFAEAVVWPVHEILLERANSLSEEVFCLWLVKFAQRLADELLYKFLLTIHCDRNVGLKLQKLFLDLFCLFLGRREDSTNQIFRLASSCFDCLAQSLIILAANVPVCLMLQESLLNKDEHNEDVGSLLNSLSAGDLTPDLLRKLLSVRTDLIRTYS
ncbi:RAD50-interacting protein 1 [Trichinella patagoniensis]|uniref:RAD50-interacting protein 1 n=1 Tax=Trichinella patagoniensis TaxID=990121 RepID=A0A0V0ZGD8_9BILA|nr:RAD50-interacting protein 1 [Trichinella patagoniensis]